MTINVIEIQVPGTPGAIGIDWKNTGWTNGATYNLRDGIYDTAVHGSFRCILTHVAEATNRPVSGAFWETYWSPIAYNGEFSDAIPIVADNIGDVIIVADNMADINLLADVPNINTLGTNVAGLATIAANITEILNADVQATNAAASASTATTQAGIATAKAVLTAADRTQTGLDRVATAADVVTTNAARDAALAALDSFDDRYLGSKAVAPTLDNDGNALVSGALYYQNVGSIGMYVYTGSAWTAAYISGTGVALLANNGSDYTAATFRTNLSLYSIAQVDAIAALKANLAGATFTGPVITPASIAGAAGFSLTQGVAPTSPATGNIWLTAAAIFARINGVTQTLMTLAGGILTGLLTVMASATGGAGLNIAPGVAPSAPNNGDTWHTAAVFQYRLGGVTYTSMTLEGAQTVTGTITYSTMPVLPANGVALAKIAQGTALSVLGITGNATANYADLTAGTDGHVLRRSGTALAFGTLVGASIANAVLTWAHLASAAIATASNYWTLTTQKIITTDSISAAMVEQALTEAVLVSGVDLGLGIDWTVTLTANRVMGAWLNVPVGRRGRIRVIQGGAGGFTITKNAVHKTAGGVAILLSTAAGAVDFIDYDCVSSSLIRISTTRAWG